MTDDTVALRHRDVERALRAELAAYRQDYDLLRMIADECDTADDVERFIIAVLSAFAVLAKAKLKDPVAYFESWIALERQLADDEEHGDTGTS